jgi:adenylate kinase family enzyme
LNQSSNIPLYHIDSIQFLPGWEKKPIEECCNILNTLITDESWIIEGLSSRKITKLLLEAADTVILIDYSIWIHWWWAIKRQLMIRNCNRTELPENCPEFTVKYTLNLFKCIWKTHKNFRPWIYKKIAKLSDEKQIVYIKTPKYCQKFTQNFCQDWGR